MEMRRSKTVSKKHKSKKTTKPKKHFWSDGISDREFIMMISVATFFFFAALGMTISAIDRRVSETYLDILQMTVPPLMTIIGSVFAVEGVELFTKRKTKQEVSEAVDKHLSMDPDAGIDEIVENMDNESREEWNNEYDDR